MTRVVLLCDYRLQPDRVGGMDRFFWALQERMLAAGWEVTWLFPDDSDGSHYEGRRFDTVLLPRRSLMSSATTFLRQRVPARTDLLVSIFTPYAARYPIDWRRAGVRRYLALDHMSRPAAPRSAAARGRLVMKGLVLRPFVSGIVAISDFVKRSILDELGGHWSSKVTVIPNGVDTTIFRPSTNRAIPSTRPHVVVVAHLIPEKGVQVLLQALKRGGSRLADVSVTVAGDGYYRPELQQLTIDLGLEGRVRFMGSTAYQDALLRSADIAVVPSLWQEAFSLSVIEAMASGVPVVASDIGGIRELLAGSGDAQAGCLVPPQDANALAMALDRLVRDSALRAQWGSAGVRLAQTRYSLDRMAREYFSHMQRLAGSS